MKVKASYFIYLTCLHLVIGGLAFILFKENMAWLLPIEVVLFISFVIGIRFYHTFMLPTKLIAQGEASLKDGDFTTKFVAKDGMEVGGLINLYNQMIDNLRRERTSKEERQFFLEKLIAAAELGIILFDHDERIDSINNWGRQRLELNDSSLKQPLSMLSQKLNFDLEKLPIEQPQILTLSAYQRLRVEKGQFLDCGFPRYFFIIQDITRDLLIAEKDAYGKVIRMMAHEVNNSTAATNSVLDSLLDTEDMSDQAFKQLAREYIPIVMERGISMNKFMHNFASVIKLPKPVFETTDLSKLLRKMGQLFEAEFKKTDITITYPEADTPPSFVHIDPTLIEQVIINALTNARESIAHQSGHIVLSIVEHSRGFIIADNGPGISKDIQGQLFKPFFSTKVTGQGIGLTLSRDILENHQTHYSLKTDEDGWTRFTVFFSSSHF